MSPTLHADITNQIIASLANPGEWRQPWTATFGRPLRSTGEPYKGINRLILALRAAERGYHAPTWLTYQQATQLGAQVRRGEKGTGIIFTKPLTVKTTGDTGEALERTIPLARRYVVFNVCQIDNVPAKFRPAPAALVPLIPEAETFVTRTGAKIRHGSNRAYYAPSTDEIVLPEPSAFTDAVAYTATKTHELIHWTGPEARCARTFGKRFGDAAYAAEELVAELGAAFLCADFGLTAEPRADHAAYIAHWLKLLADDHRAIFTAAAHAQHAIDYLYSLQGQEVTL